MNACATSSVLMANACNGNILLFFTSASGNAICNTLSFCCKASIAAVCSLGIAMTVSPCITKSKSPGAAIHFATSDLSFAGASCIRGALGCITVDEPSLRNTARKSPSPAVYPGMKRYTGKPSVVREPVMFHLSEISNLRTSAPSSLAIHSTQSSFSSRLKVQVL